MDNELKKIVDAIKKRGLEQAKSETYDKIAEYISKIQATGETLMSFLIMAQGHNSKTVAATCIEFGQQKLRDCEFLGTEILKLLK